MKKTIMYTKSQIKQKTKQLAKKLSKEKELYFITVLIGAKTFSKGLISEIKKISDIKIKNYYIQLSSYKGTKSTNKIKLKKEIKADLKNKDVVIVEDIVDTGLTIKFLKNYLKNKKKVRSIKLCSLLEKKTKKKFKIKIDYLGFIVPNKFVIGYGLDYNGKYRKLDYIAIIGDK